MLPQTEEKNENNDDFSCNSADEALCEMLGLTSLNELQSCSNHLDNTKHGMKRDDGNVIFDGHIEDDDEYYDRNHQLFLEFNATFTVCDGRKERIYMDNLIMLSLMKKYNLMQIYQAESVCIFPKSFSIPAHFMRRITHELVWGKDKYPSDQTFETIQSTSSPNNEQGKVRQLTRMENFVNGHDDWYQLCNGYIADCISSVVGEEMVLYKEKLNLKPPGGSGFAPHLDTPSLRIAFSEGGNKNLQDGSHNSSINGPKTFVTVMIAIDDMTEMNGCLKVVKGSWSENNHCDVIQPDVDGNPDAGGRAGAICSHISESQMYEPIICKGGDIVAFNGWVPHRSGANLTPFHRRAVFLTYNPKKEGTFHDLYYERMKSLRDNYKKLSQNVNHAPDIDYSELMALASIPRI